MIVFYKTPVQNYSTITSRCISKPKRRVKKIKQVSKINKIFLESLGFKV